MAYLVGGFVLLVAIILLFIFLRRRKRINGERNSDSGGLQMSFENEIYSMEDNNDHNGKFDHPRAAVNMLYMTREECQNDVTEC